MLLTNVTPAAWTWLLGRHGERAVRLSSSDRLFHVELTFGPAGCWRVRAESDKHWDEAIERALEKLAVCLRCGKSVPFYEGVCSAYCLETLAEDFVHKRSRLLSHGLDPDRVWNMATDELLEEADRSERRARPVG